MNKKTKPLVFIVCTGLGNINRGYESFTRECFDTLKDTSAFHLQLIKGGGNRKRDEIVVPNLFRNSHKAKFIGRILKKDTYYLEQVSFLLFFIPLIFIKKPALIYYSDYVIGSYLWHLRKRLRFSYRLLFANGAPNGPPYKTEDHVQQLLPVYYNIGVKCDGIKKHTCLPYAFDIDINRQMDNLKRREIAKEKLGLPPNKKIILSVGAVNMQHKRMDYLINETALLDESYYLIMLGQYDDETPEIMKLAGKKIPGRHLIKNVTHKEVAEYYTSADYFVLASLQEGFPRVTIEALSFGLPCIVHDCIIMRQVLQQYGAYIDMRFEGGLANCLRSINANEFCKDELIQAAYNHYSWDVLKERYADMIIRQLNY